MKYPRNTQPLLTIGLFALLLLGTSSRALAQEDVHVKGAKFSILVETVGDEINLSCSEGCAWKQLSFGFPINGEPQAVDQYGMTTIPRKTIKKDPLLADFVFTIKKTKEGVTLEGKEGTIWPSLTFDCPGGKCMRPIDGWGLSDQKRQGKD